MQDVEGEVLELPLHVGDAEAVRQGCVDVERLLRDPLLLRRGERRDRAHVVEPIGELDEQDADVLGHRHEHLAHARGLLGLLGVEVHPVELGDTVDDRRDLGPELGGDALDDDAGVLDRVVQQRRGQRDVVEAQVGQDERHRQRVLDVGVARLAHLALVGLASYRMGLGDERGLGTRMAAPVTVEDPAQLDRRGRLAPPGKHAVDGCHWPPTRSSRGR